METKELRNVERTAQRKECGERRAERRYINTALYARYASPGFARRSVQGRVPGPMTEGFTLIECMSSEGLGGVV